MADHYQLESGLGNYQLEDASGAYLLDVAVPNPVKYRSNTAAPQVVDIALAAGFALIIKAAAPAPVVSGSVPVNETIWGTHAEAIYNAEAQKGGYVRSARGVVTPTTAVPPYVIALPQVEPDRGAEYSVPVVGTVAVPLALPRYITLPPETPFHIVAAVQQAVVAGPGKLGARHSARQEDPTQVPASWWPALLGVSTQANLLGTWMSGRQEDPSFYPSQKFGVANTPVLVSGTLGRYVTAGQDDPTQISARWQAAAVTPPAAPTPVARWQYARGEDVQEFPGNSRQPAAGGSAPLVPPFQAVLEQQVDWTRQAAYTRSALAPVLVSGRLGGYVSAAPQLADLTLQGQRFTITRLWVPPAPGVGPYQVGLGLSLMRMGGKVS